MASKALPSPEVLRQLLRYEPETGKLFWRKRDASFFQGGKVRSPGHMAALWNGRYADTPALACVDKDGYLCGKIHERQTYAHQAAWALQKDCWPTGEIDHINGIKTDNRIENLRDVTALENRRNHPIPKHNTSGAVGVLKVRNSQRWRAQIRLQNRTLHLGSFDTKDDAIAARKRAEAEYGFHPNHGRPANV